MQWRSGSTKNVAKPLLCTSAKSTIVLKSKCRRPRTAGTLCRQKHFIFRSKLHLRCLKMKYSQRLVQSFQIASYIHSSLVLPWVARCPQPTFQCWFRRRGPLWVSCPSVLPARSGPKGPSWPGQSGRRTWLLTPWGPLKAKELRPLVT